MSVCAVDQRKVRRAADELAERPDVIGPTVLAPGEGPHHGWSLEATVVDTGFDQTILGILSEHELRLHPQPSQGDLERLVATV